jgi:hypothetical protein
LNGFGRRWGELAANAAATTDGLFRPRPNAAEMPRQSCWKATGVQPNHLVDMTIADDIVREVMAGEQVEAAVQLEAERYGVTHATAYRAWKKHARLFLPGKYNPN